MTFRLENKNTHLQFINNQIYLVLKKNERFQVAAGIKPTKKKKDLVIEEEDLPSEEIIEPDYCKYNRLCIL